MKIAKLSLTKVVVISLLLLLLAYSYGISSYIPKQEKLTKKVFTPSIKTSYSWYNPLRYFYHRNMPSVHKKSNVVYHDKRRKKLSLQSLHDKKPLSVLPDFEGTVQNKKPVDVRHRRTSKIFEISREFRG